MKLFKFLFFGLFLVVLCLSEIQSLDLCVLNNSNAIPDSGFYLSNKHSHKINYDIDTYNHIVDSHKSESSQDIPTKTLLEGSEVRSCTKDFDVMANSLYDVLSRS